MYNTPDNPIRIHIVDANGRQIQDMSITEVCNRKLWSKLKRIGRPMLLNKNDPTSAVASRRFLFTPAWDGDKP